jgi:hypothetical protein
VEQTGVGASAKDASALPELSKNHTESIDSKVA